MMIAHFHYYKSQELFIDLIHTKCRPLCLAITIDHVVVDRL